MTPWRNDNPDTSLEVMRDHFLKDGGLKNKYPDSVAKDIIMIAFGISLGVMLTGTVSILVPIATTLALYAVNFVSGFFQQVAWANLRYTYSGRYSMRVYEDLFNFRYSDIFEGDWGFIELQNLYVVSQHE
jgi:hypothetical protein